MDVWICFSGEKGLDWQYRAKKFLTFQSEIRIITNGKFKKQIFGFIGNGTSSWMVMNNTNL